MPALQRAPGARSSTQVFCGPLEADTCVGGIWRAIMARGTGSRGEVVRKVSLMWPAPEDRKRVLGVLNRYRGDSMLGRARVQLAILKLSDGSVDRLTEAVEVALRDSRDVVAAAEYPEEGRALWSLSPSLTPEQRRELLRIRRRDRQQYLEWRRR